MLYMYTDTPCRLMLVYGHIQTLLTTDLSGSDLAMILPGMFETFVELFSPAWHYMTLCLANIIPRMHQNIQ